MGYKYKISRIIEVARHKIVSRIYPDATLSTSALIRRNRGNPDIPLNRELTASSEPILRAYADVAMTIMPDLVNRRIMDIGCRDGRFLEMLAKRGAKNLAGLELVPDWVEYCQRNGQPYVRQGNLLESGAVDEGVYDFVFCRHVLEHVDKPALFFNKLVQLLSPGGILFVAFPLNPKPNFKHPSYLPSMDWVKEKFDWSRLQVERLEYLRDSDLLLTEEMLDACDEKEIIIVARRVSQMNVRTDTC